MHFFYTGRNIPLYVGLSQYGIKGCLTRFVLATTQHLKFVGSELTSNSIDSVDSMFLMSYARLQWRNPRSDFRPFIRHHIIIQHIEKIDIMSNGRHFSGSGCLNRPREGNNLSNR